MENYESKLLAVEPEELDLPTSTISFGKLIALESITSSEAYEHAIRKLALQLPYTPASWPIFDEYADDWTVVNVGKFTKQIKYCERGSCRVAHDCKTMTDLSYFVFAFIAPRFTSGVSKIADTFDAIKDHRLLIWLSMSSDIYHMYQVNQYFGIRMLNTNVTWMCQELVRMGKFENELEAFMSEKHIVHGLRLSGMPHEMAKKLYLDLE